MWKTRKGTPAAKYLLRFNSNRKWHGCVQGLLKTNLYYVCENFQYCLWLLNGK